MATYYIEAGHGGTDSGTDANPWTSLASCITYLNTNHADLVTTTTPVDVIVRGGALTIPSATYTLTVLSNPTYPLRFIALNPTGAVWDITAPMFARTGTFSGSSLITLNATGQYHIEFDGININQAASLRFLDMQGTSSSSSMLVVKNCYVRGYTSGSSAATFVRIGSPGGVLLENVIVEGYAKGGTASPNVVSSTAATTGPRTLANCTFINNFLLTSDEDFKTLNCLFVDTPTGATGASGSGYCATNLSNATPLPGSNNTYDISTVGLFVSADDRHLTAANTWGVGPDDVTYGSFVPTTDIDGETRVGSITSVGADLPASGIIISAGTITNVTTQGFQVQFEADTANGTAYYVVYTTAAPDPTATQIVAETDGDNTAALASGNQPVSTTGVQTFSPAVTGLSPNTTYRVSVVHYGTPV